MKHFFHLSVIAVSLAALVGCTSNPQQKLGSANVAASARAGQMPAAASYLKEVAAVAQDINFLPTQYGDAGVGPRSATQMTVGLSQSAATISPMRVGENACVSLVGAEDVAPVCFAPRGEIALVADKPDTLIALPLSQFNKLVGAWAFARVQTPEIDDQYEAFLRKVGMGCVGW